MTNVMEMEPVVGNVREKDSKIEYMNTCLTVCADYVAESTGLESVALVKNEFDLWEDDSTGEKIPYMGVVLSNRDQVKFADKQMQYVKKFHDWIAGEGQKPPMPNHEILGLPNIPKTVQAEKLRVREPRRSNRL